MENIITKKTVSGIFIIIVTHPVVLTILFGSIFLSLFPYEFLKTSVELVSKVSFHQSRENYFCDLNGDGQKELIILDINNNDPKCPLILICEEENVILDEWNPKGTWLLRQKPIFGDYDNNGLLEMYIFTRSNDSVFLSGIEFYGERNYFIKNKFIARSYFTQSGAPDVFALGGKIITDSINGSAKLYFYLSSGYSKYPRNLFSYNFQTQEIKSSEKIGTGFYNYMIIEDIDNDGSVDFYGMNAAPDNHTEDIQFRDNSSYLLVYNSNLDFKFAPVKFGEKLSSINPIFFSYNKKNYLACIYQMRSVENGSLLKLFFYTVNGDFFSEIDLTEYSDGNMFNFLQFRMKDKKRLIICSNDNEFFEVISPHSIEKIELDEHFRNIRNHVVTSFDIDNDNTEEYLFFAEDHNKVLVVDEHLNVIHSLNSTSKVHTTFNIQTQVTRDKNRLVHITSGGNFYTYEFIKNPLFFWKYPIYTIIFLSLFLIFHYLSIVQKRYAQEKYENEKELIRLQFSSIKNQIDPHFSINVLNSISGLYAKNRIEEAESHMIRFSRLMQHSLLNSDRIAISLEEELTFCRNFIEIQQTRFGHCFTYTIEGLEGVGLLLEVPRMLIHTFVENAIKHGLVPKGEGGELNISVKPERDKVGITIADNGIGRNGSEELKTHGTGKGLGIVDEILDLYKKLSGKLISYHIKDRNTEDPGKTGTIIEISIPKK